MNKLISIAFFIALILVSSCKNEDTDTTASIMHRDLNIEVNDNLHTRISSNRIDAVLVGDFQNSEYIVVRKKAIKNFRRKSYEEKDFTDSVGSGISYLFKGMYKDDALKIEKKISIKCYDDFPNMAIYNVGYVNHGDKTIKVKKWVNHHYEVVENPADTTFWSFQGSSKADRGDWILPVQEDFYQKNYMGMNNSDYGGGIPIIDVWRSDAGISIGHTTLYPQLVSLPVETEENRSPVSMNIEKNYAEALELEKDATLKTLETFVSVHQGDCFRSLQLYTEYMKAKGIKFAEPEPDAFEAIWCAWGYERNFTLKEIIGTLGKAKEIGFKWAVLDDGFQLGEGDWDVNSDKFPEGSKQMKNLVDQIHANGMKAKLWWAPLAVDPCTNLLNENPDIILYTDEWAPRIITWWDAYYMSPVYEKTIKHTEETLTMFLDEWGFDGLKMDGQHMNAVPPDHHPDHKLEYPEKACEELPQFYKRVYESTRSKKEHAVVENCPCGCCMSFYNMPYINQAVSSDPLNSWQIRLKGKVYKAIMPNTAYYGDHVELSDEAGDFASSFGIGAVLGSKFTWPKDNPLASQSFLLTPKKELKWKKWIGLYNELMLSKEPYLGGLYDIGFDKPETHVINKGGDMYYAFYNKNWDGEVELKGLDDTKKYKIIDYINDKDLGEVLGESPIVKVSFTDYLLVKVTAI